MSVNALLNDALAILEQRQVALVAARTNASITRQRLAANTPPSAQEGGQIDEANHNQAVAIVQQCELDVVNAELAVTAATQAVMATANTPGAPIAQGNASDRSYKAAGGLSDTATPTAFTDRFLIDIFGGGWTSILKPNAKPTQPAAREQKHCPDRMGFLFRNCNATSSQPDVDEHRQAGAALYCRVKMRDSTRIQFDYVDANGRIVNELQRGQDGVIYNNIIWDDEVERIHARSITAFDRAELDHYGDYNRTCFIIEAQTMLHWWYHVGQPHGRVPNLEFEAVNPPRLAKYIFDLSREYAAIIAHPPDGHDPLSFGI